MNTEWKQVPDYPTQPMRDAGNDALDMLKREPGMGGADRAFYVYAAMLNAAPPAPTSHPIPTGATGEEQDDSGMSPYCPECDGGGRISVLSDNSPDAHDVDIDCTHCGGTGSAADAAKNLARALQSERMQHLQIYGEYKNFHRSLCARFGYGHDPVHFRRDLVSLEEAIAAKVSAPAAGDALDAKRYRWLRDIARDEQCQEDGAIYARQVQFTSRIMTGSGVLTEDDLDTAIDAAIAQQSQRKEA